MTGAVPRALRAATLLAVASLAGCSSRAVEPAVELSGLIALGDSGRRIRVECQGAGSPAIVLVAGLQESGDTWRTTGDPAVRSVMSQLVRHTRVCAYDRPGTVAATGAGPGDSGAAATGSDPVGQPITPADAVADLHELLPTIAGSGPWVLVGHSAGGTFALQYAKESPEDVAGLVLVDHLPYELRDHERMTPALWETFVKANTLPGTTLDRHPDLERLDHEPSYREVASASVLQPLPLVVLSASELPATEPLVDAGVVTREEIDALAAVFLEILVETRGQLVDEVPGARHVTDTDSGHHVHRERPGLVAGAILEVLEAARHGCRTLTCGDASDRDGRDGAKALPDRSEGSG